MKNILALDVATTTGWCVNGTMWGSVILKTSKESSGERLVNLEKFLENIIEEKRITEVVAERPMGMGPAKEVLTEMKGVVSLVCARYKLPLTFKSASEIKKFATGKGRAEKPEMIQAAVTRWGYDGDNDNEADAICLYFFYENQK